MGKIILYFLLISLTITAIIGAFEKVFEPIIIITIIWTYIIYNKIKQEQKNRFKDWEMKKYNYNSISKKEQKEHYNEYKNERKSNKSTK